jgi:hypothetical protein
MVLKLDVSFGFSNESYRYNKPNAEERQMALTKYVNDVASNEKARRRLAEWGLTLDTALIQPTARVLDQPRIRMGPDLTARVDIFDVTGSWFISTLQLHRES